MGLPLLLFDQSGCHNLEFQAHPPSTMPRELPEAKKGAEIFITGGSYSDHEGWIDDSRYVTDTRVPVITKRNGTTFEYCTTIAHTSYELVTARANPTSYEQAVLIQHNDINKLLSDLARKLAQCDGISTHGGPGKRLCKLFLERVAEAIQSQDKKKGKARWRRVAWNHGTVAMLDQA